jgi:hypothetical protein
MQHAYSALTSRVGIRSVSTSGGILPAVLQPIPLYLTPKGLIVIMMVSDYTSTDIERHLFELRLK